MSERELWCAVLDRVYSDATTSLRYVAGLAPKTKWSNATATQRDIRRARVWLTRDSFDLRFVCGVAGFDHERVRKRAETLAKRGWRPVEIPLAGAMTGT